MRKLLSIIAILSLTLTLSGCGNKDLEEEDIYEGWSKEEIYQLALEHMQDKIFKQANDALEGLESHYPFGEYAEKGKLLEIYGYVMRNRTEFATAAAERFIELYPEHPKLDYAYYMLGVARYQQVYDFFPRYLSFVNIDRLDLSSFKQAFSDLETFMKKFPNSIYVANAKQLMIYMKEMLAMHELNVATFYYERAAYVGAANRAQYIIEHLSDTSSAKAALLLLEKTYYKLDLEDLANDSRKIYEANFSTENQ